MPVLTLRPRAMVGLRWRLDPAPYPFPTEPVFTFVLTFKARATVWLWLCGIPFGAFPAFNCVLIFTAVFPFYEIGADC